MGMRFLKYVSGQTYGYTDRSSLLRSKTEKIATVDVVYPPSYRVLKISLKHTILVVEIIRIRKDLAFSRLAARSVAVASRIFNRSATAHEVGSPTWRGRFGFRSR